MLVMTSYRAVCSHTTQLFPIIILHSSKRHSNSRPSSPTEDERDGNSSSPASKNSFGEVGPQGSLSSDESQIEKNSRRAMIVKMAKARMANNQQTSDDVSGSSSFPSVTQEGNSGNSWDVAADLD